jgi:hypothetical protein
MLTKKNKDRQDAIRKAIASGMRLSGLIVSLTAQTNAASEVRRSALVGKISSEKCSATSNAVNEVTSGSQRRFLMGKPVSRIPGMMPSPSITKKGEYRVRQGDTLGEIARKHKTTVADLKRLNGFDDDRANRIKVGEVIKVGK